MLVSARSIGALGLLLGVSACSDDGLDPGAYHWEMHLVGAEDTCHEEFQTFRDSSMIYSVSYASSDATLALNRNTFARGTIAGCSLNYESPVFKQEAPGGDEENYVQWLLEGSADQQQGGAGCGIEAEAYEILADYFPGADSWDALEIGWAPDELDWVGLETFRVVGVGDSVADLQVGCSYTVLTTGKYLLLED